MDVLVAEAVLEFGADLRQACKTLDASKNTDDT